MAEEHLTPSAKKKAERGIGLRGLIKPRNSLAKGNTTVKATYIDHMGTDLSVVNAARVSFGKIAQWDMLTD